MMARVSSPEAPPVRAVVLGRYAGVVDVLANLLRTAGITVVTTWAANADDGPLPQPDNDVVPVIPVSPGDDTLDRLRERGCTAHVVGVSWHPADEQPDPAPPVSLVHAGAITATLAGVVRGVSATARHGSQPY